MRRLVSKALEAEGEVEVVGVAADGKIALVNIERLHPDVVILDVAMPVMDGLTALAEIRQRWPGLPVIMFSTLTTPRRRGHARRARARRVGLRAETLEHRPGAPRWPRSARELLPRIAALLPQAREARERTATRRAAAPAPPTRHGARARPARPSAST